MNKLIRESIVISLSNHKGGVGKTTSTCNIGAGLAMRGFKTLLIDLDPQANLSLSLGAHESEISVYDVLCGNTPLENSIINIRENFFISPSSLDLAGAEIEFISEPGRELILKRHLDKVKHQYDYIIIDCSPSIGVLTTNALTASDYVFIPLQANYLSLQGIKKLSSIIEKIRDRLNPNLKIGGVFITQYDSRKVLNKEIGDAIEERFSTEALKTRIRGNIALAEAPGKGKDIFHYSPKSIGALDYEQLCEEIIHKTQREYVK